MEIKVTAKKPANFYIRAVATFLRGTGDKEPVDELVVSGLGNAVDAAVAVAKQTQKSKLAKITEIRTAYINLNSIMCPQITIRLSSHKQPVVLLAAFEIKRECVDEFLQIMTASAKGSHSEEGCLRFDILQDQANPCKFTCYEAYESDAAIEVHKGMPYVKAWGAFQYGDKKPVVNKTITKIGAVDFQRGSNTVSSAPPMAILLHVSIKEQHVDEFVKVMTDNAKGSRSEKGCRRFDFLRNTDKPGGFITYEVFDSQEAMDVHKDMPYVKAWGALQYSDKKPVEDKVLAKTTAVHFER